MRRAHRIHATNVAPILFSAALSTGLAAPPPSRGCPVVEPDASISLEVAPATNVLVRIYLMTEADGEPRCRAAATVPLSAFPTSRVATRPVEVARALRDAVREAGARSCEVFVMYENDTGEELAIEDQCRVERFRFGRRRHWSVSSEEPCWTPASDEDLALTPID